MADARLDELKRLDFGTWFNEVNPEASDETFTGLQVPTLEEDLLRYRHCMGFFIEIKAAAARIRGTAESLVRNLNECGPASSGAGRWKTVVQFFDTQWLTMLGELNPDVPLVQLTEATTASEVRSIIDHSGLTSRASGCVGISSMDR